MKRRKSNDPAVLVCEACHEWVEHVYLRDEIDDSEEGALYAIYTCLDCHTLRVWGAGGESMEEKWARQRAAKGKRAQQ